MIKVTVDLVPGGFEPLRRTIARMSIGNAGGLADRCDYNVQITESENGHAGTGPRIYELEVNDHDRRQSVWRLIGAAIERMEGVEFDEL
jgi:hypothetical protein